MCDRLVVPFTLDSILNGVCQDCLHKRVFEAAIDGGCLFGISRRSQGKARTDLIAGPGSGEGLPSAY